MITECRLFEIDSYEDERGALSVLEENANIPFVFKRLYYLYHTKANHIRGVHAHKKLQQVIIAFSGKFKIILDDGKERKIFTLDQPNVGLYVSPGIWREVYPLEENGVCAVLASRKYEEEDYIHDYDDFLMYSKSL
jgi:dTDP-4-dehydrorhamnose 3,5-epimerase-like enzyme